MSESISSVGEFAADNYATYKDAYADYVSFCLSSMVLWDKSVEISRGRMHDIAVGGTGDQVDLPLNYLKQLGERVAALDRAASNTFEEAESYSLAGDAHYQENAAAYHDLAVNLAEEDGVRIEK